MNRFLLTLATFSSALAIAASAFGSDGIAFSAGSWYSSAVVSQAYVAPVVQAYAAPAQYITLPQVVQIVRPEIRLRVQQVQSYAYTCAAPVVQKVVAIKQPVVAQKRFVQKQTANPGVAAVSVGPLGRVRSVVGNDGRVQQFGAFGFRRP